MARAALIITVAALCAAIGRSITTASAALHVSALPVAPTAPPPTPTRAQVLATMEAVNGWFMNNTHPALTDCGWEGGTYAAGCFAHAHALAGDNSSGGAGNALPSSPALSYLLAWAEANKWRSCSAPSTDANNECCGHAYTGLYMYDSHDLVRIASIKAVVETQVNRSATDDWWWVDALFMAMPTFSRLAAITGDSRFSDKLFALFNDTSATRGLWSESLGLYYRDTSYFNKTTPSGQPVMWARGNGWAAAGLARSLDALPADDAHRAAYAARLTSLATTLAGIQGSDGFWRASLLDASQYPGPETTGTALMTAAIASGVAQGVLPPSPFTDVALKGWHGLATVAVQADGMAGYCQPVGASPAPAKPTDTSDFCTGQVLLAGAEIVRMLAAQGGES